MNNITEMKQNTGRVLIDKLNLISKRISVLLHTIFEAKEASDFLEDTKHEIAQYSEIIDEKKKLVNETLVLAQTKKRQLDERRTNNPIQNIKDELEIKRLVRFAKTQQKELQKIKEEQEVSLSLLEFISAHIEETNCDPEQTQNELISSINEYNAEISKLNALTSSSHPLLSFNAKTCKPERFDYVRDYINACESESQSS